MKQIPQEHIDFCKELTALAKKHNVVRFSFEYQPGGIIPYGDRRQFALPEWHFMIRGEWARGRHGEPAPLHIESQQHHYEEI